MKIESLTLGEVSRVEELSGQSIALLGAGNAPMGKTLAALAYVFKRRSDLTYKFEDALNLTMDEANAILDLGADAEGDEAGPTTAP